MRALVALGLGAVLLAGCASVRPQEAFEDVQATVAPRADYRVVWRTGAAEDAVARAAVDSLLARPLTAEAAVQVALLNNRRLQATYEDLGVAQAELVQAGLLANPVFGGRVLWPLSHHGHTPALGFNVAFEFLNVFYRPLRRAVAQSTYEAARLRVAEAVLDHAARTRIAYYRAQAATARQQVQGRVVESARAAYEAALLLREAGNTPATALLAEQVRYEQARLDLLVADGEVTERREALVRLMGLYGAQAHLELDGVLPPPPEDGAYLAGGEAETGDAPGEADLATARMDVAALERQAVERSLALAAARADVEAYARRLGVANATALLPDLEVGGELEREDGEWMLGPEVEVVLPLFDMGQGRRAAAQAELRRRQAGYHATGVEVRSAARVLARRLATAHRAAVHYQTVLVPLGADLVQQTLLQYNAMQTGVFGVLQARQMEVDTARRYVEALAAYWEARVELDALLAGRMPEGLDGGLAVPTGGPAMRDAGH